jgi:hypothetical protein
MLLAIGILLALLVISCFFIIHLLGFILFIIAPFVGTAALAFFVVKLIQLLAHHKVKGKMIKMTVPAMIFVLIVCFIFVPKVALAGIIIGVASGLFLFIKIK